MVHAQVYNLAEDTCHRLDQGDQRCKRLSCAGAKGACDGLLDVCQPRRAECVLDGVPNVGDTAYEVVEHLHPRRAEDVPHDRADAFQVVAQNAHYGDYAAQTGNDRAKRPKQGQEPARQGRCYCTDHSGTSAKERAHIQGCRAYGRRRQGRTETRYCSSCAA